MVPRKVWFSKEFIGLVLIVLFIALIWGWSALKPVDLTKPPKLLFSIPENINSEDSLKSPMAVAVRSGILAATDNAGGKVKFFFENGVFLKSLKVKGSKYLSSLAFDSSGGLYVGDLNNQEVYYYESPLKESNNRKVFKKNISPTVIETKDGLVYIADVNNSMVKIFDGNGKEVKKPIMMSYVNGIAIDDGLYLSDSNKGAVFSYLNGKIARLSGDFSMPRGMAFDRLGNLHIVDTFANSVKVYKNNRPLYRYGGSSPGNDSFSYPNAVAIDIYNDRIFIADKGNNRVQVLGW